jgi:hypothetical protein
MKSSGEDKTIPMILRRHLSLGSALRMRSDVVVGVFIRSTQAPSLRRS